MIVIDANDDVSGKIPVLLKKGVVAVGRHYSSEQGERISPSDARPHTVRRKKVVGLLPLPLAHLK
jgi:hypothetical protein